MQVRALLPDAKGLELGEVHIDGERIIISVSSKLSSSVCPQCGESTDRVHSRYFRKLSDLPWHGYQVTVRWQSRRFFCDQQNCAQRIFTERLPNVAQSYGRRTCRMNTAVRCVGMACGGESGSRLSKRLGIIVSPSTLLREVRRTPLPERKTPRVLGVDDWAFRKGQKYGTIFCDLEEHRPVDLIPERSAESFQEWLIARPGVDIISRDRGDCYIKGATAGAPNAVQVADRWHLLRNLGDALVRVIDRFPQQILAAAKIVAQRNQTETSEPPPPDASREVDRVMTESESRRFELYQKVVAHREQGLSQRKIANELGLHRETVGKFLQAKDFRQCVRRKYVSSVDPFEDYLRSRWQAGCHNGKQLAREIQQQGFEGAYSAVRRFVAKWRKRGGLESKQNTESIPRRVGRPSSRHVSSLVLRELSDLSDDERELANEMAKQCDEFRIASELSRSFATMLRQRQGQLLNSWFSKAIESNVPKEIQRFARGLEKDFDAVEAGLTLPWSNGQTEGQVNRLKLIKRQMFGPANFDLLRKRFLAAA